MLPLAWYTIRNKILPIGLDIGHGAIKMVQLASADDGIRVVAVERAPAPATDLAQGSPNREDLIRTIRQMLTRGHFRGRNVVSVLPHEHLWITSVRLADAEMSAEDSSLRKEAAQRFGLDADNDAIEYLPAGNVVQGDEIKNEYIVLAAKDEAIRSHISLLEEAGLRLVGIDAAPCALFRNFERLMRRQEDRERTIVFIDVGYYYTTVVFARTGEICLIKQMAFGAARFDEDVATRLEISGSEAQALRAKLRTGEAVDADVKALVVETLQGTAEQLAGEISLCLRYYTVTFRGKRVERAVIAGAGACEPALLDVIRRHLAVETEVAEPLRGFDVGGLKGSDVAGGFTADLALAVGLSLKGWSTPVVPPEQVSCQAEPVLEGEQT
jgi:type IV pilus assembly protein PilM